ncbi:MAG: hypothetical protein ABTD50_24385 [Polyangiaceae bacterium]|jgi:hypothetical protein
MSWSLGEPHLGDLSHCEHYEVRLAFTGPTDPSFFAEAPLPLISLADEVIANSATDEGARMREEWGRIPYGSPLYVWQLLKDNKQTVLYIGKTVKMHMQDRQEGHKKAFRILCKYVNEPTARVCFRMCTVFDIIVDRKKFALEHLPLDQADRVLADVESCLIHWLQPEFNSHYKARPGDYWKPFRVVIDRWMGEELPDDPLLGTAG